VALLFLGRVQIETEPRRGKSLLVWPGTGTGGRRKKVVVLLRRNLDGPRGLAGHESH
jgi:hypothetical protein